MLHPFIMFIDVSHMIHGKIKANMKTFPQDFRMNLRKVLGWLIQLRLPLSAPPTSFTLHGRVVRVKVSL